MFMEDEVTTRLSSAFNTFASAILGQQNGATAVGFDAASTQELEETIAGLQRMVEEEVAVPVEAQEPTEVTEEAPTPEVTYPSFGDDSEALAESLAETPVNPIPENSSSILIDETTSRFSSAIWYEKVKEKMITLAGLGCIGSYTAFLLGRMKPNRLIIYDNDRVETGNLSGQFFSSQDCGQYKATAISNMLDRYAEYYSTVSISERFTPSSQATNIMICGFDNMEARKIFYNSWKSRVNNLSEEDRKLCLFIDGRLAAEEFQVLCIAGDDTFNMQKYERDWLFTDAEAEATVCSYKQTSYMANMIGSIMVNLFTNFCANECDPIILRDLPFLTSYDASMMYFKTEV